MKISSYLIILITITTGISCKNDNLTTGFYTQDLYNDSVSPQNEYEGYSNNAININSSQRKEQIIQITDPKTDMVISQHSYPNDWKVMMKPYYTINTTSPAVKRFIKGPNGVTIFNNTPKTYVSISDPSLRQLFAQLGATSGATPRPWMSIEQIVQQEIGPKMQQEGFTFENAIIMTDLKDYRIQKFREKGILGNRQIETVGTIWKNNQNKKAMIIVNHLTSSGNYVNAGTYAIWMYTLDYIFADADALEPAVTAFKNSILSEQINPQWNQLVLQRQEAEARRSAQISDNIYRNQLDSYALHQQKMKGINQAINSSHKNFMANLRGTSGNGGIGSTKDHNRFINLTRGEETVIDPNTGYEHQVQSGYDQTYFDQWGNPVQTNDPWYDGTIDGYTPAQRREGY